MHPESNPFACIPFTAHAYKVLTYSVESFPFCDKMEKCADEEAFMQ